LLIFQVTATVRHYLVRTLSSEDAFFLYLETPDQHQHVVATIILDPASNLDPAWAPGPVDIDSLIDTFEAFTQRQPQYRQKLVKTPFSVTPPVLVEDPHFVFRNHIRRIAVPAPGTLKQLAVIVEDIASTPLSQRRPLWEAWFISGLENDRMALVLKSHHCLADGVNGTEAMTQLFDIQPVSAVTEHPQASPVTREPAWEVTYRALLSQWRYQPRYLNVLGRTARCLGQRRKLFAQSKGLGELVPGLFEEAPKLKFNAPITANRIVAMGSLSLTDVKHIKQALGITVNDVVVSACTLALREYLIATDDLPDKPLICCQPVSLILKGQDAKKPDQGNQVGTMSVRLPVQIDDIEEMVRLVCRSTAASKTVFEESFENLMNNYIGLVPPTWANWALKNMLDRRIVDRSPTTANLIISNVPGPPVPLYLAGARMEAGYGMGPVISGQGPNLTFTSYADKIHFSVLACREQMPEIWMLAEGIESALEQIKDFALPSDTPSAAANHSSKGSLPAANKHKMKAVEKKLAAENDREAAAVC
jgi:diacylglycerol O-acyltransferase